MMYCLLTGYIWYAVKLQHWKQSYDIMVYIFNVHDYCSVSIM